MRRSLVWLAALLTAGGVAGAVLGSVLGGEGRAARDVGLGGQAVAVAATVSSSELLFGDRAVARLAVSVDRALADPDLVDVRARFRPFRRVGPVEISRRSAGQTTVIRYEFPIQCVDRSCLPRDGVRTLALPPAIVEYVPNQGLGVEARVEWPEISLGSRLTAADRATPRPRGGTDDLPPVSYRVSPALLGWLAAGLSAALVLALGAASVRRLRPRAVQTPAAGPEEGAMSPLERALGLVEDAAAREVDVRRTALDGLARTLEGNGLAGFAPRARRLAWSAATPEASEIAELTAAIRRELGRVA